MKKYRILFVLLWLFFVGVAQEDAWVYLKGKPDAQYFFDHPLEMLSQRSLDRRAAQNIALDVKDIPIATSYINQIKAVEGIEVKAQSKWLNALHVRGAVTDINNLKALTFVDYVQFADKALNGTGKKATVSPVIVENYDKFQTTKSSFAYGTSANQAQMLNLPQLHEQDYTGSGKVIAVLDSGFSGVDVASPFQRLRDNNQILGGYNFVDRNQEIYSKHSHGTMVLSALGGYKPDALIGTAPDATFYLFITEDAYSENPVEESYWVEAAEKADALGADILSTSLGYFKYDNPNYSYTYEDMNGETSFISRGMEIAFTRGMICVTAAGNSGSGTDPHVAVPGDAKHVLTVGAVQPDENYASFSSIGPTSDGRVKPDIMAQGQSVMVSDATGEIIALNGTSFSTPIMSGAIACLWQAKPEATNQEILDFVKHSADRFGTPTYQYGYGIPDFVLALNAALFVENKDAVFSVKVFPNPVSDKLTVAMSDGIRTAVFDLYNAFGQKVIGINDIENGSIINLEELSSGIYFYTITVNGNHQWGKIIKK